MRLRQLAPVSLMWATMVFIVGCGAHSTPVSVVPEEEYGNLAGNWLVNGSLPSGPTEVSTVTTFFTVTGNQVKGYLFLSQLPCETSPGINYPVPLAGTVAPDGTFSLMPATDTAPSFQSATVEGAVPSTAGGSWKGTYSYSYVNTSCSVPKTSFSATAIASTTGTYSGTALLYNQPPPGEPFQPGVSVPIAISLEQGNYVEIPSYATAYTQMSGTISVANSPCLKSGTLSQDPATISELEGSTVAMYFLMNDGSTLQVVSEINNQSSSILSAEVNMTSAGTCGQLLSVPLSPTNWVTLSR